MVGWGSCGVVMVVVVVWSICGCLVSLVVEVRWRLRGWLVLCCCGVVMGWRLCSMVVVVVMVWSICCRAVALCFVVMVGWCTCRGTSGVVVVWVVGWSLRGGCVRCHCGMVVMGRGLCCCAMHAISAKERSWRSGARNQARMVS